MLTWLDYREKCMDTCMNLPLGVFWTLAYCAPLSLFRSSKDPRKTRKTMVGKVLCATFKPDPRQDGWSMGSRWARTPCSKRCAPKRFWSLTFWSGRGHAWSNRASSETAPLAVSSLLLFCAWTSNQGIDTACAAILTTGLVKTWDGGAGRDSSCITHDLWHVADVAVHNRDFSEVAPPTLQAPRRGAGVAMNFFERLTNQLAVGPQRKKLLVALGCTHRSHASLMVAWVPQVVTT